VLTGGVIGVVVVLGVVAVVLGVVAVVLLLRRSHDDVHSVEHYHRQLHTLEEIRTHPTGERHNGSNGIEGSDEAGFPASAFRLSGSSTVRLTEPGRPIVPPAPPPPVPNPGEPMSFDDANPEPVPATFMTGNEDRVIHSINHRPRRIGGPAAAVAAVLLLIAVLIITGLHSNTPKHSGKPASAATTTPTHAGSGHHHATTTTTTSTTAPPAVSAPTTASAHGATYTVDASSYALNVAATTGECWVDVTNTTTGSVLFTATLQSGQSHAVTATGPVTVIAGAPAAFSATVNGAPVTLPPGNQAPFTLNFQSSSPTSTT
jgi:hypothetical protein